MKVTEITVRFMRRVQIKDYEPAEAEVSLKAHLDDDDDSTVIGPLLILQARVTALTGLRGKTAGETETEVKTETIAAEKPPKGRKKGSTKKKAAAAADDIPDETASKGAKTAAKGADVADVPDDDDTPVDVDSPTDVMSADELQSFITDTVSGKRITVAKVKEILAAHKANRTSDVKPEDRGKVKDMIEMASSS